MSKKTKWSYCVGAVGRDAAYALVSMYLILYVQYTMNLTTAQFAVISAGMVVCMVWDAINDLMMGILIENTHWKMGKFKPWILLGAILNALVIVALFTIRPTGWGFVAFYCVGYLLWGMTYTMNDIAYWGMLPSLSSEAKTRNVLVTTMSVFTCVGQFAVAGVVPMVIAGNAVTAYRVIALVVGLAFILFQTITALGTVEKDRREMINKLSLSDMFGIFKRNDQLVYAGIGSLLFNIGQNLLIIFGVNFFYVEFGYAQSGNLVFLFTVMYGVGALVSQAAYAFISSRLKRQQILSISTAMIAILYLCFLSVGYILPKNIFLLNSIGLLIFFFQGLINLTLIVMINNTIEYDEYRFSERNDSVISAVRSFSVKLAAGVNQGLSTLVLVLSGIYAVSRRISELEIQVNQKLLTTNQVLESATQYLLSIRPGQGFVLRLGMTVIPIATIGGMYLLLRKKYFIDENEYDRLVEQIASRDK
ncbi:MAG: MFS transporter [Lachnospiraceae bacterium]|nr:MFS transporter [Lachnospiraceae bacterium]